MPEAESAAARRSARLRGCVVALLPLLGLCGVVQAATDAGALPFVDCHLRDRHGIARVKAECARFAVTENRADAAGRQIGLHVARVRARLPDLNEDPVVLLAGGPGQSAADAYVATAPALQRLNRERDILLIDQRGTGGSNRLACPLPDLESGAPADPAAWRALAVECLQKVQQQADVRFYTTSDYIDDLEAVRAALGGVRFNLVGGSYGTRVALEYLRRHPGAIRSVVLDGVVPPELALTADHARNLDAALTQIFERCRRDPACSDRFADPGATLSKLREQLRQQPLQATYRDPVDFTLQSGRLGVDSLAAVVRLFAYAPETASLLPLWLAEAAEGRVQPLLAQVRLLTEQLADQLAHGMELSVVCTEDAPSLGPDPADAGTLLGGALVEGVLAQCEVWPRGRLPDDFKQPVVSDKPVLILSGEFDPVTPPRYGEQVAHTLSNSRHVVAPGQGHIVMARGCLPRVVAAFVDDLEPALLDAACVSRLGAMPAFLDFSGFRP